MAAELTEVMVKYEGSEAFREVVWVLIEELHSGGWHIGGRPFQGPKSLMDTLSRSAQVCNSIEGTRPPGRSSPRSCPSGPARNRTDRSVSEAPQREATRHGQRATR